DSAVDTQAPSAVSARRHKASDLLAAAGDRNLLAGQYPLKQLREIGLRLVHTNRLSHGLSLPLNSRGNTGTYSRSPDEGRAAPGQHDGDQVPPGFRCNIATPHGRVDIPEGW